MEIGKKRFQRGLIFQQEVNKLTIDQENDRALLRDAQTASIRAVAKLDKLLGHHQVRDEWPWQKRLAQKAFPLSGKNEAILKDRPDWQTAEKRLSAAHARVSQSSGENVSVVRF